MDFVVRLLLSLSVVVLFTGILLDFIFYHPKRQTVRSRKSMVETFTMTVYFCIYYGVIRLGVGHMQIPAPYRQLLILIGLILVVGGCAVNMAGRYYLGHHWANQVKVYEGHQVIRKGPYSLVRHPLYASIIAMLIGGGMVYRDYLALLLTVVLFIPMMVYRSRQEEQLLLKSLPAYGQYRQEVGMLFPKLNNKENKHARD